MNGELDENMETMVAPERADSFDNLCSGNSKKKIDELRRYSESMVERPPKGHHIAWVDETPRRKTEADVTPLSNQGSCTKNKLPPIASRQPPPPKPARSVERTPSIVPSKTQQEQAHSQQQDDMSLKSFSDNSAGEPSGRFPLEQQIDTIVQTKVSSNMYASEMPSPVAGPNGEPKHCDHPAHRRQSGQKHSEKSSVSFAKQSNTHQASISANKFTSIPEDRDPNNLNNDAVIGFDDIYGEPLDGSTHSLEGVWRAARRTYDGCHWCCYLAASTLCALPSALCFGCWFACVASRRVWCYAALGKACNLSLFAKCWGSCVHAICAPCVEIFGACVNKVRGLKE